MAKRLIHSFAWDLSGRLGEQFVGFFIGILLARLLSPAEFGLIGMSMVLIAISDVFVQLGLSSALVQRSDPTPEHYSSTFYLNIAAAAVLAGVVVLCAPLIAAFFQTPSIAQIARVLALSLVISSLSLVQEAWLRKRMQFAVLTKAKIVSAVVGGLVGVGMAWQGFGVWSLVAQTLVSRSVVTVYYWIVCEWKPRLVFSMKAIRELWGYSASLFASGVIDTLYGQLDSIVIARLFSAQELGLYSRAKALNRFVIQYSSASIGAVTFPAMAAIKDNRKQLLDLGLAAETLVAFSTFGLLGWLYVSAESLILTLLGPKWLPAAEIFRLLCLSGFAYPISAATLSMLKATGDTGAFLKVEVWKKLVGVVCLCVGFFFGLNGFLIGLIVSGTIAVLMNMYVAGKSLGISIRHQLLPLLVYLVAAVFSAAVTEFIPIDFESSLLRFLTISLIYVLLYLVCNSLLHTRGFTLMKTQLASVVSR